MMNKTVLGSAFKELSEDGSTELILPHPAPPPGPHLSDGATMTRSPKPTSPPQMLPFLHPTHPAGEEWVNTFESALHPSQSPRQ